MEPITIRFVNIYKYNTQLALYNHPSIMLDKAVSFRGATAFGL
jgi:hypothetical protein